MSIEGRGFSVDGITLLGWEVDMMGRENDWQPRMCALVVWDVHMGQDIGAGYSGRCVGVEVGLLVGNGYRYGVRVVGGVVVS